jgi:isoleucyl-tRNA synthetase
LSYTMDRPRPIPSFVFGRAQQDLKDVVNRSQQMLGEEAPYVPGWDYHGLPIEWIIEEKYQATKQSKDTR